MKNTVLIIIVWSVSACVLNPFSRNNVLTDNEKSLTVPQRFEAYGRNDDFTIILTFSGGGTRAAAFSYGVMQGLRQKHINVNNQDIELLHLVDVISSVSGGSFTSAYYGLFGDKLFTDFEEQLLKSDIQSQLTRRMLINPINWFKFMSGNYSRSELTAQYYQKKIFADKTFADIRPDSPAIMINATDIATGAGFSFTEEHFRWLCSDLRSYSIGKAVTASSAVPVIFSPVLLENHEGCDPFSFQLNKVHDDVRYKKHALLMRKYQNKEAYPYLHLVDGGVADNLGVRALLNQIYIQDNNFWNALKAYRLTNTKKVMFIVVNAAATLNSSISLSEKTPKLIHTLNAVTTIQSQNYNADTLDMLEQSLPDWAEQVKRGRCAEYFVDGCDEFEFYFTELNFNQLDEPLASELANIETALQLPADEVDMLISAGKKLLVNSDVVNQFMIDIE